MRSYETPAAGGAVPPQVGEQMMIVPYYCETDRDLKNKPQSCRVQFVNMRGRFFTVQFDRTGLRESFPFGA